MASYKSGEYKGLYARSGSQMHRLLREARKGLPRHDLKRVFGEQGSAHLGAAIQNGWVTCTINITAKGEDVLRRANQEAVDAGTSD